MIESIHTQRLKLRPLAPAAIRHLIAGERDKAREAIGLELPQEFPNQDELGGFLPVQLQRMEATPERRQWMARLIVARAGGRATLVGHCGFHGPPEVVGRAEIGYTVFTPFRGRGYAKEAARGLVDWAFAHDAREVYASVSPDNAPSLAVVRSLGFIQVGTQVDAIDGLELVFALRAGAAR